MTNLIEDGGDLVEELQADTSVSLDDAHPDVEDFSDRNWMPDPMDAPPGKLKNHLGPLQEINA